MKFAASRSLLHGTVGRGADGERPAYVGPGVGVVVVASPAARSRARARCARYAAWRANMSKSPANRGPACSRRQASAARASTPASAKSAFVERAARAGSAITSIAEVGPVLDAPRRPTPGLGRGRGCWRARRPGRSRAARRRSASSAPRRRAAGRRRSRDADVVVGQAARQVGDAPGPPRQDGEAVQRRASRHAAQSSKASTTAWSMVCFGPVNHFLAEACHQIVEQQQRADGHDRRVVDELPREVVVAERAARRARTAA